MRSSESPGASSHVTHRKNIPRQCSLFKLGPIQSFSTLIQHCSVKILCFSFLWPSQKTNIFLIYWNFGKITCFGLLPWSHMPTDWSKITNLLKNKRTYYRRPTFTFTPIKIQSILTFYILLQNMFLPQMYFSCTSSTPPRMWIYKKGKVQFTNEWNSKQDKWATDNVGRTILGKVLQWFMTCALSFVISGQKLLKIVQMTGKWDKNCVKKKKQMRINKDEVMD